MSTALAQAISEGRELTPEEAQEYAADQIKVHFGLSVDEFTQRVESGDLSAEDDPMVIHLALLTGVRLPSC